MFLRRCRQRLWREKIADSTGARLTGGSLLMRTMILRRLLRRLVLAPQEEHVGVLLPPSAPAVVVNAALALDRRVAVNLNYTASSETINACIRQAEIRHVLTSRRVLEKLDLTLDAPLVFLEDFKAQVRLSDKLAGALAAYATPLGALERALGLTEIKDHDLFTIVFTSGSTGEPKGVMLSFDNLGHNVAAIERVIRLRPSDVMCGVLPFFHSFGYTVTLWGALALDIAAAYHFSPLDAKQIGSLCREHRATLLLITPTFLRGLLRRCEKSDFATVDVVVTGAEKLPADLAQAFGDKFGVRPVEGYGITELSPLVSVNIPPSRADAPGAGMRAGSVGKPVPDVLAKSIDAESRADLPPGEDGLLQIKGPNVMLGYLHHPEMTAQVVRDGWYDTGDIAHVDADGYLFITGRLSRFSKLGGEMVPHIKIEETLQRIVAADENALTVAVSAVPDPRKGERLVVLHTGLAKSPEEICKELSAAGLPNLWIPSPDSFRRVAEIPILGSGKLDLRRLKELAAEEFLAPSES